MGVLLVVVKHRLVFIEDPQVVQSRALFIIFLWDENDMNIDVVKDEDE
jgi:hypothetical protein